MDGEIYSYCAHLWVIYRHEDAHFSFYEVVGHILLADEKVLVNDSLHCLVWIVIPTLYQPTIKIKALERKHYNICRIIRVCFLLGFMLKCFNCVKATSGMVAISVANIKR